MGGYHIEWKQANNTKVQPFSGKVKNSVSRTSTSARTSMSISKPVMQTTSPAPYSQVLCSKTITDKTTKTNLLVPIQPHGNDAPQKEPAENNHALHEANTSLVLGLLAITIPIGATILGYALYPPGANDASLAAYIILWAILWIVCMIVGFIIGLVALSQMKHGSENHSSAGYGGHGQSGELSTGSHKGKVSAIVGVVLTGLVMFLLLFLFALVL